MKDGLFKQEVKISDNETVTGDNQYFDESQFYTGLLFALGASVFGAIANILVSKCSSHSSLLLTFWRYSFVKLFLLMDKYSSKWDWRSCCSDSLRTFLRH